MKTETLSRIRRIIRNSRRFSLISLRRIHVRHTVAQRCDQDFLKEDQQKQKTSTTSVLLLNTRVINGTIILLLCPLQKFVIFWSRTEMWWDQNK